MRIRIAHDKIRKIRSMPEKLIAKKSGGFELIQDIVEQINSGRLQSGDPIRSTSELAETYQISYQSAHKALQQLAREGYCVRVPRKGTFVHDGAAARLSASVAVPARFESNPFHAHMVEELTLQATLRGIKSVVGRDEHEAQFIERMASNGVKAMIRFPGPLPEEVPLWGLLQERQMRCVMINDFWLEGGPFPSVRTDEEAGIIEMTEHLIALGHRRILLIDADGWGYRGRAFSAFYRVLRHHGIERRPDGYAGVSWTQRPLSEIAELALRHGTAAIVMYDTWALDLMSELERRGVVLGKDFSLAGFDGTREAAERGLSTVVQPVAELVAEAYRLLREPDSAKTPKIMLKPTCAFRTTTGPAPVGT